MANKWYSIIVNGKRYGFFHLTRCLKQDDPLSPALFILGAVVLSKSLNRLHNHPIYHGFFMEVRGAEVNHLSFVDDIILFTSGRCKVNSSMGTKASLCYNLTLSIALEIELRG